MKEEDAYCNKVNMLELLRRCGLPFISLQYTELMHNIYIFLHASVCIFATKPTKSTLAPSATLLTQDWKDFLLLIFWKFYDTVHRCPWHRTRNYGSLYTLQSTHTLPWNSDVEKFIFAKFAREWTYFVYGSCGWQDWIYCTFVCAKTKDIPVWVY